MPRIQTVLGDISPADTGLIYHHEHIISSPPARIAEGDPDLVLDSEERIVEELQSFRAIGGGTVCDASAIDYGRDVKRVIRVAQKAEMNIISTSGFNKGLYFPEWIVKAPAEELEEQLVREVAEGIDGTSARAGQLKFGTSYNHITPAEEKAARAACRAQRRTHAPLFTHTQVGTMGLQQLELMRSEGVNLERACIGHLDRNPDRWYIRKIADHGAYISIDQVSKTKYYTDEVRVGLIIDLIRAGYQRKILLSADLARKSYLQAYGGGPGFAYVAGPFRQRLGEQLSEEGFAAHRVEQILEDLFRDNAARFYTFWDD